MRIEPVHSEAHRQMARGIRQRVFVEEQACPPEEEWDEHDATSRHIIGFIDGEPAATARWRTVPHEHQPVAKLERFAVLPAYRGHGHGRRLVRYVMDDARRAGFAVQVLHAQAHLEAFYASFGFVTVGVPFTEAGIPHVKMVRRDSGMNA